MKGVYKLIIVLQVNAPEHMTQGIKETLAMFLERFGDTKILEIKPDNHDKVEQMRL